MPKQKAFFNGIILLGDVIMFRSIYDILNKNIDYSKEYKKIKKMFLEEYFIDGSINHSYTYGQIFNNYILKWKYRGTKCSLKEILDEIEQNTDCGKDPITDCLYLCELILNIREFLIFAKKNYFMSNDNIYIVQFNDEMLIGNILYILKELGYCLHKEEDYKIILVKDDADAISTAIVVEDNDISNLIMQYNDFKIVNNIKEKQKILFNIAKYLEPKRSKIKEKNKDLEQNLFMAFNKLNIRHNNIDGKDKEDYTSNLSKEELLQWYDRTFNLSLIAIRLIELKNIIEPFDKVRKEYFS